MLQVFHFHCYSQVASILTITSGCFVELLALKCLPPTSGIWFLAKVWNRNSLSLGETETYHWGTTQKDVLQERPSIPVSSTPQQRLKLV